MYFNHFLIYDERGSFFKIFLKKKRKESFSYTYSLSYFVQVHSFKLIFKWDIRGEYTLRCRREVECQSLPNIQS